MAKRIRTYYEILGVPEDADSAAIRKGYRQAIRQNHPDLNPDSRNNQKRTRELNEALNVLTNVEKRQQYDEKLARRSQAKAAKQQAELDRQRDEEARRKEEEAWNTTIPVPETQPTLQKHQPKKKKKKRKSKTVTRSKLPTIMLVTIACIGLGIAGWFLPSQINLFDNNTANIPLTPNEDDGFKLPVEANTNDVANSNSTVFPNTRRDKPINSPKSTTTPNLKKPNVSSNQSTSRPAKDTSSSGSDSSDSGSTRASNSSKTKDPVKRIKLTNFELDDAQYWFADEYEDEIEDLAPLVGEAHKVESKKFAEKLLRDGKYESNPAKEFLILQFAFESTVAAGSPVLANQAIERLAVKFDVDDIDLLQTALTKWNSEITSERPDAISLKRLLAALATATAESAVRRDRMVDAVSLLRFAAMALPAGSKSPMDIVAHVDALKLKALSEKSTIAKDKFDTDLCKHWWELLGQHWCFELGQWEDGAEYLEQGKTPILIEVAKADSKGASTSSDAVRLANLWLKVAEYLENPTGTEPVAKADPLSKTNSRSKTSSRSKILTRSKFWLNQAILLGGRQEMIFEKVSKINDEIRPPSLPLNFEPDTARKHQLAWADYLGQAGQVENSVEMFFNVIPPGKFELADGSGQAEVPFAIYLGTTEVTQEQYDDVMRTNPSWYSRRGGGREAVPSSTDSMPVESITRELAIEFCNKLSESRREKKLGRVYRLPTEVEWEFACRAGTSEPYNPSGQVRFRQLAWYRSNANSITQPVASKLPNPFGLFDMHGNVCEFCLNKDSEELTPELFRTPTGVQWWRGGSFNSNKDRCDAAFRGEMPLDAQSSDLGFRVVLIAEPWAELDELQTK